jgi:hypothetical protein
MNRHSRKNKAIAIAATRARDDERARLRHLGIACLYAASAFAALAIGLLG